MGTGISYNSNISISVQDALQFYNVKEKDLKYLNPNNDKIITLQELKSFGLNKYSGLTNYFDQQTSGALLLSENPNSVADSKKQKIITKQKSQNPFAFQGDKLSADGQNLNLFA